MVGRNDTQFFEIIYSQDQSEQSMKKHEYFLGNVISNMGRAFAERVYFMTVGAERDEVRNKQRRIQWAFDKYEVYKRRIWTFFTELNKLTNSGTNPAVMQKHKDALKEEIDHYIKVRKWEKHIVKGLPEFRDHQELFD